MLETTTVPIDTILLGDSRGEFKGALFPAELRQLDGDVCHCQRMGEKVGAWLTESLCRQQQESGVFPLTVWIVPSAERKEKLIPHIRKAFDTSVWARK